MLRLFEDLARFLSGTNASISAQRSIQRLLGIGAMVLMITALGPYFGYGLMAIAGVVVMLLTRPEKEQS